MYNLINLSLDKMADISQTTFSDAFLSIKVCILIKISLKFVPKGPINNKTALFKKMAGRRIGAKPLSEPCWPEYEIFMSLTHFNQNFLNTLILLNIFLNTMFVKSMFKGVQKVFLQICVLKVLKKHPLEPCFRGYYLCTRRLRGRLTLQALYFVVTVGMDIIQHSLSFPR